MPAKSIVESMVSSIDRCDTYLLDHSSVNKEINKSVRRNKHKNVSVYKMPENPKYDQMNRY